MYFNEQLIDLATEFKTRGLAWEPAVGDYVYDATGAVKPSSPFQDHVYFLLNYDCFMQKVGGVEKFKELMTWLPTWHEARDILQKLGVSNSAIQAALLRTDAIERSSELCVLYEMIAEQLSQPAESVVAAQQATRAH